MPEFYQFLIEKSPLIFLLYIILDKGVPIVSRWMDHIIPARVAAMEQKAQAEEERKNKELDLLERRLVVDESTNKILILLESAFKSLEFAVKSMAENNANAFREITAAQWRQGELLAVLVDRTKRETDGDGRQYRRRKTDKSII